MNMELYSDQGLYLGSRLTTNLIYPRANTSSIGLHTDLGLTISKMFFTFMLTILPELLGIAPSIMCYHIPAIDSGYLVYTSS